MDDRPKKGQEPEIDQIAECTAPLDNLRVLRRQLGIDHDGAEEVINATLRQVLRRRSRRGRGRDRPADAGQVVPAVGELGVAGLVDRSSRPYRSPHQTDEQVEDLVEWLRAAPSSGR